MSTAAERLRAKHGDVEVRRWEDGSLDDSWTSEHGSVTLSEPSQTSGLQRFLDKMKLGKRSKRSPSPAESRHSTAPLQRTSMDIVRPSPVMVPEKRMSWTPSLNAPSSITLPHVDTTESLPPLQPKKPALFISHPSKDVIHSPDTPGSDVREDWGRPISQVSINSYSPSVESPQRAPSPKDPRSRSRSPSLANPRHLFDKFIQAFTDDTTLQPRPSNASRRIKSIKSNRQSSPSPARGTLKHGKFSITNPTLDLLPGPGARMGTHHSTFGHARRNIPKSLEMEWNRQDLEHVLVWGGMAASIKQPTNSPRRESMPPMTPLSSIGQDPPMIQPSLPTRRASQVGASYSLSFRGSGSNFFDETMTALMPEQRFESLVRKLAETNISVDSDDEKV